MLPRALHLPTRPKWCSSAPARRFPIRIAPAGHRGDRQRLGVSVRYGCRRRSSRNGIRALNDDNVTVTAIPVPLGPWTAFGYRIDTADRSIVVSGDTRPTPALAEIKQFCDGPLIEAHDLDVR